jgi:hypothetical protein
MAKVAALLLSLFAVAAFAQDVYTYPAGTGCGVATPPVFCGTQAVSNADNGQTATVWTSWPSVNNIPRAPAVGQTFSLSIIWVALYLNGANYASAAWSPGGANGDSCYGTVTNNGVGTYPYVITGTCSSLVFSDGEIHAVSFTQNLDIYTIKSGRKYWGLGGGSFTVQ